jgi:hypothetical protein
MNVVKICIIFGIIKYNLYLKRQNAPKNMEAAQTETTHLRRRYTTTLLNIVRAIKSIRIRWVGHVALFKQVLNTRVLFVNSQSSSRI